MSVEGRRVATREEHGSSGLRRRASWTRSAHTVVSPRLHPWSGHKLRNTNVPPAIPSFCGTPNLLFLFSSSSTLV